MIDNYIPFGFEWEAEMMKRTKKDLVESYKEVLQTHAPIGDDGWIELVEGCELPDYDEHVLWLTEDGNCYWDALDKDGNPWIFQDQVEAHFDGFKMPKTTHWKRITLPKTYNHE